MAELFFPSLGIKAFYACIIIYLYGRAGRGQSMDAGG